MAKPDEALRAVALCWTLERADGAGVAVSSHDRPMTVGGIVHEPVPGIVPAAVTRSLGLEPHSSEVAGALDTRAFTSSDLALGRWDGARAALTAVDWETPESPPIELMQGELSNVGLEGDGFSAELLGAAARLDRPVCPSTSAYCRAEFGDKACRVDLAGRTRFARVLAVDGSEITLDQEVGSEFLLGRFRYLAGTNCGLSTVVVGVEGATVRVRDLPRAEVEPRCRVELREGCDKTFATCAGCFANAVNFRGEPHLPGADRLTRFPGV